MAILNTLLHPNDREILNSLLGNDKGRRKGEEMLFRNYAYFIREGIKKFRISEEDAFDAYSETILTAITQITDGSFRANSSLKTFLFSIYNHKCVDLLRKKSTKKYSIYQTVSLTDISMQFSDAARSIIQRMIDKTDFTLLQKRLNELGEKCKQLLLLSAEGYTDKDITMELEFKTADVVKTSRLRCLKRLRELYKQQPLK